MSGTPLSAYESPVQDAPVNAFRGAGVDATLACKTCAGTTFNVGRGPCETHLRCTACGWERLWHDG